jgi:hypothetical protein
MSSCCVSIVARAVAIFNSQTLASPSNYFSYTSSFRPTSAQQRTTKAVLQMDRKGKKRDRPLLAPPHPFFVATGDISEDSDGESNRTATTLPPIVSANYKGDGLLLAEHDLAVS